VPEVLWRELLSRNGRVSAKFGGKVPGKGVAKQLLGQTLVRAGNRLTASSSRSGFTLVEVILAIFIALGILVVLLYFYEQATNLRAQSIQEMERLAATRLLMDRITGELRTAQIEPSFGQALVGTSNEIQFVKSDVPSFSYWSGAPLGRSSSPVTDLKLVSYRLEAPDGTNVLGLARDEEPLIVKRQILSAETDLVETNASTNVDLRPVVQEIRFLQFRYWTGTNWMDSWNSSALPQGVEVSLGSEPATNGMDLAEYPAEIYRRVIYLPGSGIAPAGIAGSRPGQTNSEPTGEVP
jgi:type II secretory pathway pseudopilin PulG